MAVTAAGWIGHDELAAARDLVAGTMAPTPTLRWPQLCDALGTDVWVKHENHGPIGSFKLRGGLIHLERLTRESAPIALVTASRGNHGQSVAYAATRRGLGVTVVVPVGNNREKNAAMRALGADVVVRGADLDAAKEEALELARRRGWVFVPSYGRDFVLGAATAAHELLTAVPDLDTVVVPVGTGSGIVGMVAARDLLGLRTRVVGVVSVAADAYARSLECGRLVETDEAATFADGVACRRPDPSALTHIAAGVSRIVRVPDHTTAEAMRLLLRTTHNLPEPAGALALAAVLAEPDRYRGRSVAVVLSGGNVDAETLAAVLRGETPAPRTGAPREVGAP